MRALLATLACAAAFAACGSEPRPEASGGGASGENRPTSGGSAPQRRNPPARALAEAPPELAALRRQQNRLLGGGAQAFKKRLTDLEGHPVVVNKWASWCPPCRAEFPFFARQATARGHEVAFLGVDSGDSDGAAARFLERFPVPYPHYTDPDMKVAEVFHGIAAFPTTAFYDSKGKLVYLRQGGYATERKLAEDIDRYAR